MLNAVAVNDVPLGNSALFLLRSRWLETQWAVAAELPPARGRPLAVVPPNSAIAVQHLLSALPKIGIYAALAASYALIYGIVGRINLAFGAFVALGGVVSVMGIMLAASFGSIAILPLLGIGAAVAVLTGGLAAFVVGRCALAPLAARPGQHALIASIGLAIAMEEFLRLSQGATTKWLPPVFSAPYAVVRAGSYEATVTPMALAVAAAAGATCFALLAYLEGSRFGRDWRAVADEPNAAELFGISANGVLLKAFVIASSIAAFVGLLISAYYGGIGFAGGFMLGMTALIAAIAGGIGSVRGAMLGGLLIGGFEALWSLAWPIAQKDLALFVLLSALLILKPDGLFAGRLPGPMRV